ncbi:MAG: VOC family protein [Dehalococcoidia bacterium]
MPTATGSTITSIGQIAVNVTDMDRAVAFYRDVAGLPFLFQAGPNLAFLQAGDVRLMLDIPEDERFAGKASVIYYKVEDLEGAFDTIKARGAEVESEPHLIAKMPDHELWMAFFKDTEGNFFALMSEVR